MPRRLPYDEMDLRERERLESVNPQETLLLIRSRPQPFNLLCGAAAVAWIGAGLVLWRLRRGAALTHRMAIKM